MRRKLVGILFSELSLFSLQVSLPHFSSLIIGSCFTNIGFVLQEESKINQMILLDGCSS